MTRKRSGNGSSSTHMPGASAIQSFLTRSGQRAANSAAIQRSIADVAAEDHLIEAEGVNVLDVVERHTDEPI